MSNSLQSPFCILRLPSDTAAKALISRAILSSAIYELWGTGSTYSELHSDVTNRTSHRWSSFKTSSFRFTVDSYRYKHSNSSKNALIETFSYLGFTGPIVMHNPDLELCVLEDWTGRLHSDDLTLSRIFLGRLISFSSRDLITTYDLKKRPYISTTSMDAELALISANLALASPGKLFFDPFLGTGGFPIAIAHFGAFSFGADIDARPVRGKPNRNILTNFKKYGTLSRWLDAAIADLTNAPIRVVEGGLLDGIICDPPYGVREGLKVLGRRDGEDPGPVWLSGADGSDEGGEWAHLREGYIAPKKPYSFEAMLDDILDFAATMLVPDGRLAMWMPSANDEDIELGVPRHARLDLLNVCVQPFSKWSRRLLVYRKRRTGEPDTDLVEKRPYAEGSYANELNQFRKRVSSFHT
jgi:tRNA (guanine10-N2)-methyltransferase